MKSKQIFGLALLATIILTTVPLAFASCPPKPCALTPGFWKHNIRVYLGYPGRYSVPHPGEPRINADILDGYLGTLDPRDALAALSARGPGSRATRIAMANYFNDAADYQLL